MKILKLIDNPADYGDAEEIFVTGISAITRVSAGVVRVSYYAARAGVGHQEIENHIVLHVLWDASAFFSASKAIEDAAVMLQHAPPPSKGHSDVRH